jgi:hypothetical protein
MQLQLWDTKARAYEHHSDVADTACDDRADNARSIANGRNWRICKPDRPLKPRYVLPRHTASDRTTKQVIEAYLTWAIDHKLKSVTMYYGKWHPFLGFLERSKVRHITQEEQFAVVETTDESELAQAA